MLSPKELHQQLKPGAWVSDGSPGRGTGALWFRRSASRNVVNLYFGYAYDGQKKKLPIGTYDPKGKSGMTLPDARRKYMEISRLYQSGTLDLHGHFDRQRKAEEQAIKAAEEAERRAAEEALRGTLRQLLFAYVEHLERAGKVSAEEVRGVFDRHVVKSDEAKRIIDRRAAELVTDDFVDVIGAVVKAGKGRQAGKLRSYLRAAYASAVKSKTDADLITLRSFGVSSNPIASIGSLSKYNRTRDRNLSAPEMTAFLRRLDAIQHPPQRDALKVSLLLGGQRPTQLLRAKVTDIDLAAGTITLYDPKGRRTEARRHDIPLMKEAVAILKARLDEIGDRCAVPVFSTDDETPMCLETLSTLVHDISDAMVKDKEARAPFMLSDLRRTCETMMASLKVAPNIRGQIQSHGLGGVQNRHYDRHDYALEKQQTLRKWAAHLVKLKEGKTADVVPLAKGRRHAHETRE